MVNLFYHTVVVTIVLYCRRIAQGIESLDALLRCQQKVMKMIEIIKVKQQSDPLLGRASSSPGRNRKNKYMEGSAPHGHNVRVDTKQEWLAQDRRVLAEEEDAGEDIEIPNDEEDLFTRESIKEDAERFAAEQLRMKERAVGVVAGCS